MPMLGKHGDIMVDLKEFYNNVGSDADDAISRLGGNARLAKRFVKRFLDDKCFSDLLLSLEKDDAQSAFRAAHTLKGVAVNLGMQTLFVKVSEITELLGAGKLEESKKTLPALQEEYFRVRSLVEGLV